MTEPEFDLIASLIRSREPAKTGARLVLISKLRNIDAAKEVGVHINSVTNTVARFRSTHKEITKVFGQS